MRCLLLILSVPVLAVGARPLSADDTAKRSDELQVLDRFIGTWDSVVTNKTTGEKSSTTEQRRWSRKGTFVLSEDFNPTTEKEAHFLMTYDPHDKAYRTCFMAQSNTTPIRGTWEEEAQTMGWNGADAYNNRVTGTRRFIDKDTAEWLLVITNPEGQVLTELSAKQKRRKE